MAKHDKVRLRNSATGGEIDATVLEHERVYTEAKGWGIVDPDEPTPDVPAGDAGLEALAALTPEDLELLELLDDDELADLAALIPPDQEA